MGAKTDILDHISNQLAVLIDLVAQLVREKDSADDADGVVRVSN